MQDKLRLTFAPARQRLRAIRRGWPVPLAAVWRRVLRPEHVVAVTGSCGKSTTVALISAILSRHGPTRTGVGVNTKRAVARSILRTRWWHRYLVQEVSGHEPGAVARSSSILLHDVAVVTTIRDDHHKAFRGEHKTADEKGLLVSRLPAGGLAVLNADDPVVMAMANKTQERVITFGMEAGADIRALNVHSAFPTRLSLTLTDGEQAVDVQTKLVGTRWVMSVLAAVACGRGIGIPLEDCARAIEAVEPAHHKDSVHRISGGPTFILDTFKAPLWTIPSTLETLRDARMVRRTVVFGTISDYHGSSSQKYRRVAREALEVSERVIFLGKNSGRVTKLAAENPGRLWVFDSIKQASDFLKETAVPGELIYIKTSLIDHLERLFYDWREPICCWLDDCGKSFACDYCKHLFENRRTRRSGFNPDAWTVDSDSAA